jgi:hypothetical protein
VVAIEANELEANDFNDEADDDNKAAIFLLWLLRRLQQAALDGDVDGLASGANLQFSVDMFDMRSHSMRGNKKLFCNFIDHKPLRYEF